jgi:hypothetical protein
VKISSALRVAGIVNGPYLSENAARSHVRGHVVERVGRHAVMVGKQAVYVRETTQANLL